MTQDSQTITALNLLVMKWMAEQATYPNDPEGHAAAAAVRLCAKELNAALNQGKADMTPNEALEIIINPPATQDWKSDTLYHEAIACVRKALASLPSPPVSGRKFDLSSLAELDEDLWPIVRMELREAIGDDKYNAFVKLLSPLTAEPVGVTISRELAEDIREALEDLGACPDDECTQCKRVLARLSASITGEKG